MHRDGRPLHLSAFLGVGLLVTPAPVGVDRRCIRSRPTELLPSAAPEKNQPHPPPWMKVSSLEQALAYNAPDLMVVQPDPRSGVCFVFAGPADPPAGWGDDPHACRAGDFRLLGDVELMARVGPAAESIRVGPYPGVGGPVQPPP